MKAAHPFVAIDLETTGTDMSVDRIVQIGMVKVYPNGSKVVKNRLVNPNRPIPAEATEVHNISDTDVAGEPTFAQIAKSVLEFIDECEVIVTFNGDRFDLPLLYNEFYRAGIVWDHSKHVFIDVMKMYHKLSPRTLVAAAKQYLGIDFEDEAHDALNDVNITIDVLMAMLNERDDIPQEPKEIESFCNDGTQRVDIAGFFVRNTDGDIVFSSGKHKGEVIEKSHHSNYLNWMIKSGGFSADTTGVAINILNNKL